MATSNKRRKVRISRSNAMPRQSDASRRGNPPARTGQVPYGAASGYRNDVPDILSIPDISSMQEEYRGIGDDSVADSYTASRKIVSDIQEAQQNEVGLLSVIKEYGTTGALVYILDWINGHQLVAIPIAMILVSLGIVWNKYIAVIGSLIMIGIGYLSESQEQENDSIVIYVVSMVTFIIPFLF